MVELGLNKDRSVTLEKVSAAVDRLTTLDDLIYNISPGDEEDLLELILEVFKPDDLQEDSDRNTKHDDKFFVTDNLEGADPRIALAMELVAKDILLTNRYDLDGKPTKYWEHWKGQLEDYVYAGNTKDTLMYLRRIISTDFGTTPGEVLTKYTKDFSEDLFDCPIIVVPESFWFALDGNEAGFFREKSKDFEPPFDVKDLNFTIYRHKHHRIGLPVKKFDIPKRNKLA